MAGARAAAVAAALALLAGACAQTDVVGYRALRACTEPSCTPMDGGGEGGDSGGAGGSGGTGGDIVDSGSGGSIADSGDASDDDAGDASDAGDNICAAATCDTALTCSAPVPRAIVGDSCGDQAWAAPAFRHALCSCGDYVSAFPLTVQQDPASAEPAAAAVAIDGMLGAGDRVDIQGPLYVAGDLALDEGVALATEGVQSNTAMARCDCSSQVTLVPAAVLALVPENPDGFDVERFNNVQSDETVALDCGSYRVPRIAGASALNLTITGHVVLVVEGDIEMDGSIEATLAEGALLELFVIGNVRIAGALILGDEDDDVRLYALGGGTIDLTSETFVAGPIYAPNAELVTRSNLTTTGSIFVRRAAPGGAITIRYDSATSHAISCDD